jgi:hypothetical protein
MILYDLYHGTKVSALMEIFKGKKGHQELMSTILITASPY